jgi:hypothetical protein
MGYPAHQLDPPDPAKGILVHIPWLESRLTKTAFHSFRRHLWPCPALGAGMGYRKKVRILNISGRSI